MIEKLARAMAADLGLQDYGMPFLLDDDLKISYLDQGEVDFAQTARACLEALREPSPEMIEAGIRKAEDCKDSDWDSGPDGESHNSYEYYRSDAPFQIWQSMIDVALLEDR